METMTTAQYAGFGMPATGRVRFETLRALPSTRHDATAVTGPRCVLVASSAVSGHGQVIADVVVGAFPGAPAWSPPM